MHYFDQIFMPSGVQIIILADLIYEAEQSLNQWKILHM